MSMEDKWLEDNFYHHEGHRHETLEELYHCELPELPKKWNLYECQWTNKDINKEIFGCSMYLLAASKKEARRKFLEYNTDVKLVKVKKFTEVLDLD